MAESEGGGIRIGLGFMSLVFGGVLVYLKVNEHIGWSWKWVLAPFWMPLALSGIVIVGLLAFMGFILLMATID